MSLLLMALTVAENPQILFKNKQKMYTGGALWPPKQKMGHKETIASRRTKTPFLRLRMLTV